MSYRCCACVDVRGDHVKVTIDIDLESMKFKGSLVFVSTYMFWLIFSENNCSMILKFISLSGPGVVAY